MEVSGSAFILPPPVGWQDGEGETSGVSRSKQVVAEFDRQIQKGFVSRIRQHPVSMIIIFGKSRSNDFDLPIQCDLFGRRSYSHLGSCSNLVVMVTNCITEELTCRRDDAR
ncbi:hypothetical protein TNCV_3972711 [Trichonephila clavipes]|nr:hypothetical protein TNCV_3972711 [Trichonephila clavipes]